MPEWVRRVVARPDRSIEGRRHSSMTEPTAVRAEIDEKDLDEVSNPSAAPTIGEIIALRLSRRETLKGMTGVAAIAALAPIAVAPGIRQASATTQGGGSSLTFPELAHGLTETHGVADGYEAQLLIRWGDPVVPGAPAFDPNKQTAAAQAKQWGYNNDFVAYMPLPLGSKAPDRALLCVNFEYTNTHMMFPGIKEGEFAKLTKDQVDVELAAHGHAVIEIRRDGQTNAWSYVKDSPFNRRISMLETECRFSGPAAGHARLQTSADPTGTKVIGTLNNCAGGKTPWGTVLSAEENFHQYFGGDPARTPEARNYARYGIKNQPEYGWHLHYARFDVEKEPNEANRFGWIVEIDPYDPTSIPVKRTALGRFKHECATCVVNKDGRVVVYSGDDERFDYVYKFVTEGRFDPTNREANRGLLDKGTLFVGRFSADGKLTWLPLAFGQPLLTPANDFISQADVLIETRRAADLVGATPMDRPEDVETNPVTGVVYVALTNNTSRKVDKVDGTNPRGPNPFGHVLEMIPPGTNAADRDHAATEFTWSIFLLAGNPKKPEDGARYHPDVTENGWLTTPDNVAFDNRGRLWIATDGANRAANIADGTWATDVTGPGRALTRHFYRTPLGAELCGPEFNTDDTAYFAAVQHPGEGGDSTFDRPSTRWPDFQDGMPPRPSIQVLVKKGGGPIGT
jgi:hypothetical protein